MYAQDRIVYYKQVEAYKRHAVTSTHLFPAFPEFTDWLGRRNGVIGSDVLRARTREAHYIAGGAGPTTSKPEYRR